MKWKRIFVIRGDIYANDVIYASSVIYDVTIPGDVATVQILAWRH